MRGADNMKRLNTDAQINRHIMDSNPLAVAVLDHEMKLIDCNEAALKLLDAKDKEHFLNNFFIYSLPIQPNGVFAGELAREIIETSIEKNESIAEWTFRNINGENILCEVTSKKIDYDDAYVIILYIRDLREVMKTYAEVKEITERNKIMIDVTPICFVFFDHEFNVVDCNPVALSLFGIPTKEAFIKNFFTLNPEYQEDGTPSVENYRKKMQKAFNEGRLVFEWDHMTVSGEALPVEVTFVRVEYRGSYRIAGYFRDLREHRAMIREMLLVEQELRVAKELAEESVKVKTEFLANMSHEIRTPMNAVLGVTEIMIQYEKLPEEIEEGLGKIYSACDMLLGIINDILDFSKIEAGKLDILPAHYMTASLINDSVHLNMMRLDSKPIVFDLKIGKKIPENLIGDELRIKQILNNLLSNAFKYTDAGSVKMSVTVERKRGKEGIILVLNVRDTGHGMTKEQLSHLFEEYSRFHEETFRTIEGTGLGLTITRHLVYLMGGEITVESEKDVGTSVTVRLPQGVIGDSVLSDEITQNLLQFRRNYITNKKRSQIVREPMPYGSVLVVDDVETNLYVATGLMKPYRLQINTAMRGKEAINMLKKGNKYDIIFMDHMMPEMDGIEATKKIRELGYTAPVVALTANAVSGQADIFLQSGFDDFISKPIDIRQLNQVLNKYIRDKQPPEVILAARNQAENTAVKTNDQPPVDSLLLDSFLRDARNSLAILEDMCKQASWAENDEHLRKYTVAVHGMKSSLWNINETDLSDLANSLETGGRERNIKQVSELTPGFLKDLRILLDKLEETNGKNEEITDKNDDDVKEKLQNIIEMCADYNRGGALKLISEIERCTKETRKTLKSIQQHILHSDFEEAETELKEHLTKI